ncbi:MAG: O-antigen ligase family protein [Rhodobacterales bacterium]|nr:O-antigen ligase family protein [Rhodobacterales bacterium]
MTPLRLSPQDRVGHTRHITLCPNIMLGAENLTSLVFLSYLGRNGVLIFLLTGLLLLLRRINFTIRELLAYWWLLLLPLWCMVSALWSQHPDLSLRHGTQLLITFIIAIALANRLSPAAFLRIQFSALLLAGIASILVGSVRPDGVWIGIFASKNYYAFTMVALLLCSVALLADRNATRTWRMAGLGGALLAVPQIVMAESVGAFMTSVFVLIGGWALLSNASLPPARQKARILFQGLLLLTLFLIALRVRDPLLEYIFRATGKDPSLTGRTELWDTAIQEIGHAPILGTGYRAFWVEGNALAEVLWAEFHIESKSGFNFHNLYLSNAVEIGITGVALQLLLLVPALFLGMRWLLRTGHAPAMFGFMAVSFVIGLSFVEVPVFFEFHALSVMVLISLVYGLRAVREVTIIRPAHPAPAFLPRYSRGLA